MVKIEVEHVHNFLSFVLDTLMKKLPSICVSVLNSLTQPMSFVIVRHEGTSFGYAGAYLVDRMMVAWCMVCHSLSNATFVLDTESSKFINILVSSQMPSDQKTIN